MPLYGVILLDLFIIYFLFGNNIRNVLQTPSMRRRSRLRSLEKACGNIVLRNEDLMTPAQLESYRKAMAELAAARRNPDVAEHQKCIDKYQSDHDGIRHFSLPGNLWMREHVEMFVVALGVAFGLRALFIQPFKIPTGSMQPTLYGIHFVEAGQRPSSAFISRFFSYLNYSRRNMTVEIEEKGNLNVDSIRAVKSWPLFARSQLEVGGRTYTLPGSPDTVMRILADSFARSGRRSLAFEKGDTLLNGYLELGDHLFVNRVSLCFREPRRGDVMVFVTDGLKTANGQSLGGRFYIKRLAGLPGDELMIRNHKLYVKEPGAADFRQLDGTDDHGFDWVHSCTGDYHGYAHMPGSLHLRHNEDSFTVPAGHYFMLGDNSENSLDSRYWGCVPRRNLVGTAGMVWWPFTRRWGRVNATPPLPEPTPPSRPALLPSGQPVPEPLAAP